MDHINETTTLKLMTFSWYDYALFALLLGASTAIGIFFGCFGNKQSTAREYLLGGKTMSAIPIALSLVASQVSGVTLLAVPTDIYLYGTTYCWSIFSVSIVCVVNHFVFLPVFCKLGVTSIYEYIKLRFNTKLRLLASFINTLVTCAYLPIIIYIPALAFSQGTNISVHWITPVVCTVCIFYTTIGGLKAVVWTDALQFGAMIAGIIAVLFVGVKKTGGFGAIWQISKETGRLDYDLDWSPFKRDSLWAALIGLTITWLYVVCVNPGAIQKFLALPNYKEVRKALILFALGETVIKGLTMFTGLIMVAHYRHCDPITSKVVKKHDQMLPYFIMDVAGNIPGLTGLFIAGVFSASLSTLSAIMNSLSATIYEDFIAMAVPKSVSQKTVSNILKMIVVVLGVLTTGLVFLVENLGGLLALSMKIGGVMTGPLLGIFTLGIMVPKANSKGAFYGTIVSLMLMLWMMIGSLWYKSQGVFKYETKPLYTDGCSNFTNVPEPLTQTASEEEIFFLYRITHYYYVAIGYVIVLLIGIPVSYITKESNTPVNKDLLSPVIHWMLPKEHNKPLYYSVDKAIEMMHKSSDNISK